MLGRVESEKKTRGEGRLLQEIEALGQALYLKNSNPPKRLVSPSTVRSKSAGKTHFPETKPKPKFLKEESSQKDKKSSSIWNWKPLKALSYIRNRRFNCCFSLQVHSIEGLSENFDNTSLCVHWKRRDGGLQTRPVRVLNGKAEFEETLSHSCSVYGSGNGPHHSAKYEAKHFLLYASVVGTPDLDLGKHRMDLTRLLPLTLEELEEEKCSGKWTTSFKLSGKAKGASLNVSFGFLVIGDNPLESRGSKKVPDPLNSKLGASKSGMGFYKADRSLLQRVGSRSGIPHQRSLTTSQSVDLKTLHEVLPSSKSELSSSLSSLYQKFDEGNVDSLGCSKPEFETFSDHDESLKPKPEFEVCSEHIEPQKPKPEPEVDPEHAAPLKLNPSALSESGKDNSDSDCEDTNFTIVEQGIEMPTKGLVKLEENTEKAADGTLVHATELEGISKGDVVGREDLKPSPQDEAYIDYGDEFPMDDGDSKENSIFNEDAVIDELDSAFQNLSFFDSAGSNSSHDRDNFLTEENYSHVKTNYKGSKAGKSLSFDDATDSVASEFLSKLGIEHGPFGLSSDSDPESPRERLLRQFEKETLAGGNCIFGFDIGNEETSDFGADAPAASGLGGLPQEYEFSSVVQAGEEAQTTQDVNRKTRAKLLEDLETEALMREWGLNEKAFQSSPPNSASGFGSPIHLPPEEPLELPPLGEGLGPFIQTKDGGFLRSMNPSLFKNAKNSGNLIMQVSSPVVVPADMGSGIMEILQNLASVGIEKLSVQASKLMPLEDITGRTMQQVAWEAEALPSLEAPEREVLMQHEAGFGEETLGGMGKSKRGSSRRKSGDVNYSSLRRDADSEYVSLEDLAPLAMDKIEALSIEGLRIQSGLSDEDAPSNINPQAIGDMSALEGKRTSISGSLGLEGAGVLQLLDMKDSDDTVDGLMGLSITLDEWMRLDAGIVDEEDEINDRTSKILAAHHATCTDLIGGGWKGEKRRGKKSGKRCGLLGNNFTVALMVQLRDPLRNYEPVGTPMLSLIQVERVFVPPKPKIYSSVSERQNTEEDDESELIAKEETKDEMTEEKKEEEEGIAQFKITEVHVAGLKTEPGKKKLWGTPKQQQSGSRWLLASGMGKSNKHPFMKSKTVAKSTPQTTTTVQPGETLWSISSRVHGTGAKWKELAALNPHIRNPNVIFPNETIRLH